MLLIKIDDQWSRWIFFELVQHTADFSPFTMQWKDGWDFKLCLFFSVLSDCFCALLFCVLSGCAHCRVPPHTQMAVGVTGIREGGLYCDGKIRRAVQPPQPTNAKSYNIGTLLEHIGKDAFLWRPFNGLSVHTFEKWLVLVSRHRRQCEFSTERLHGNMIYWFTHFSRDNFCRNLRTFSAIFLKWKIWNPQTLRIYVSVRTSNQDYIFLVQSFYVDEINPLWKSLTNFTLIHTFLLLFY